MSISQKNMVEQQLLTLISPEVRKVLQRVDTDTWHKTEEIRIRQNRPLSLNRGSSESFVGIKGNLLPPGQEVKAFCAGKEDISRTMQLLSNCSMYAYGEELRRGYMALPGGHRVGLCGKVVLEEGRVKLLSHVNSLNFRIARQIKGGADKVIPFLLNRNKQPHSSSFKSVKAGSPLRVHHTLIISPPQGGKTTLLRDICRCLGDGMPSLKLPGFKVGLVDERSEIAGCFNGVPQLDVGLRTDVLDGCPKAEGMVMMLRSMSPRVIITDEIGRDEDAGAVREMVNAGVTVITTAHAGSIAELTGRPQLYPLLKEKFFERVIVLSGSRGAGTVETVTDLITGKNLYP